MPSLALAAPAPAGTKISSKKGRDERTSSAISPRSTTAVSQLFALLCGCTSMFLGGGRHDLVVAAFPAEYMDVPASALFSPDWVESYHADDTGCTLGRGSYTWRPYGFGSNMNSECSHCDGGACVAPLHVLACRAGSVGSCRAAAGDRNYAWVCNVLLCCTFLVTLLGAIFPVCMIHDSIATP